MACPVFILLQISHPFIDTSCCRRISPKTAAAGAFSSPSLLVAPAAAKNVPEKGRYWPWDPGIFTADGAGKPISPPVKLIRGVHLKSSICLCGRCQKDDECWFCAKEDRSFVKSGHWGVKKLKEAESSISFSPPKKPKKLNRI